MTNYSHFFCYAFLPIGQGLFGAGVMGVNPTGLITPRGHEGFADERIQCSWVYDCGTSSSDTLLVRAISMVEAGLSKRKRLDLVTISHFDRDHISGVCRLVKKFRIGTLMLPYMPLAQRLVVAFAEDSFPNDELSSFLLNPVAHLLAQDGPGIEQILFVPPSGGQSPEATDLPPPDPGRFDPDFRGDPGLDFHGGKPDDSDEWEILANRVQTSAKQTQVLYLPRGEALRVGSLWEFVPYNDDPEHEIPTMFRFAVRQERHRLLHSISRRSRNNALRKLRRVYDAQFGDSSYDRNRISLYLYAGPIYDTWRDTWLGDAQRTLGLSVSRTVFRLGPQGTEDCSIIYCGDGYLNTPESLQRLSGYLGKTRIQRTAAFQVMHHGSEFNWHKGVAAAVAPKISIFSSDPARKQLGHPHAAVLRDFWPYGPCQVDKERGITIAGSMLIRDGGQML